MEIKKNRVGVIDYGFGNIQSVVNALEEVGASTTLVSDSESIFNEGKLVLPGVGAFSAAMAELHRRDLVRPIVAMANCGIPILGICLGMQLLFDEGQEFEKTKGLGLLDGSVVQLPRTDSNGSFLKSPHIGWAEVSQVGGRDKSVLLHQKKTKQFYFLMILNTKVLRLLMYNPECC